MATPICLIANTQLDAVPPDFREYTVGTGGVAFGDPVVIGTSGDVGKIVKATGGGANTVVGIAQADVAAGSKCLVCMATGHVIFQALADDATGYVFGTPYGLKATTLAVDAGDTSNGTFTVLNDVRSGDSIPVIDGIKRVAGVFKTRLMA